MSGFTPEQRRKGQLASVRARKKSPIRTVRPSELPIAGPPTNLDEAITLQSWCATAVATGLIDPRTSNEVSRACGNLRGLFKERDTAKKLAELTAQLAELKKGRVL